MASNINPYNIDGTYPTAGQDNPSQGFRDNFTNIKNNLIFAQNEINDLQAKAIVTTPLAGQTLTNNMAGTQITAPQLKAWTQAIYDQGIVSSAATLDFTQGNFQKITTAGPIGISIANWPATTGTNAIGYGSLRVWFVINNVAHTVTLPSSISIGVDDVAGYDSISHNITFDAPGDYVFDISSVDGGTTFLIFDLTRNRVQFRDPSFYYNKTITPTLLVGFNALTLQTAIALETGTDTFATLGSMNSVNAGDLAQGNISTIYSGPGTAGYTVTSTRGNLTTGVLSSVLNNDLLGYNQAYGYTGVRGVGGMQQMAAMGFYAVGTGTSNGIGGNIAFFTRPDGSTADTVTQAMSIENDQSVRVFNQFRTDAGIIENGTIVTSLATTNPPAFTANTNISTLIIDSINSGTINAATIILPSGPADKQTIRISTVAPITTANIYPPAGALLKYVPANYFATGNIAVSLTYNSASSTWYRR